MYVVVIIIITGVRLSRVCGHDGGLIGSLLGAASSAHTADDHDADDEQSRGPDRDARPHRGRHSRNEITKIQVNT